MARNAYGAARRAAPMVQRALNWYRGSRSQNRTSSRRSGGFTGDITFQHDQNMLYRRRRAPKRMRRRARKFSRRVNYIINEALGQQTAVINWATAPGAVTPTDWNSGQFVGQLMMYTGVRNSAGATAQKEVGDVNAINSLVNGGSEFSNKIRFKSAVMDVIFTNYGETPAVINIYEIVARTDAEKLPTTAWQQGIDRQLGSAVNTINYYGLTPFDTPFFGTYWLITKKRRIYLDAGKNYSFMIRYPRDLEFDMDEFNVGTTSTDYARKGVSRGILYTAYGSTFGTNMGGQPIPGPFEIGVGFTKTYHYCELESEKDQLNADPT